MSILVTVNLEIFRLPCKTIKRGVMLDLDTEPAGVVAPDGASPAKMRVMWQHWQAASRLLLQQNPS